MLRAKLTIAGSNFIFGHINENYSEYLSKGKKLRVIFRGINICLKDVPTPNDTNLDWGHDSSGKSKGEWLESVQIFGGKSIQQSLLLIFPSGKVVPQNFASAIEAFVKLALYKSALLRSANIKLVLPRLAWRKSASTSKVPSRLAWRIFASCKFA